MQFLADTAPQSETERKENCIAILIVSPFGGPAAPAKLKWIGLPSESLIAHIKNGINN
jgi:hypothetical protein